MIQLNSLKKEFASVSNNELESVCGGQSFPSFFSNSPLFNLTPAPTPPSLPSLVVSPSVNFNTLDPRVGNTYGLGVTDPRSGVGGAGSYNPTTGNGSVSATFPLYF